MPNRIIKESICTSDKIASLSDFEFRLWASLLVLVDDAGRGDARPAIIKGRAFPLRERVSVKDIENALHGLAAKGCVSLYEVGGKPYFWFPTWGDHQRLDRAKPKYPGPDEADLMPRIVADCGDLPQIAADCGLNTNTNPNTNPNTNTNSAGARELREKAFLEFWEAYPKKVGKKDARKAFDKVPREAWPHLVPAVEAQKKTKQWQKDDGQFIPNPSTWLNQGRWEDSVEPNKSAYARMYEAPMKLDELDRLLERI